jgi:hypothetical protein
MRSDVIKITSSCDPGVSLLPAPCTEYNAWKGMGSLGFGLGFHQNDLY